MIAISVGPASASVPIVPMQQPLGRGDVDVAGAGDDVGRRRSPRCRSANIAMACAPPAACTSVTPSSAQAASTAGAGRPPCAALGGDATAISPTPATWAGMTFITTDDG